VGAGRQEGAAAEKTDPVTGEAADTKPKEASLLRRGGKSRKTASPRRGEAGRGAKPAAQAAPQSWIRICSTTRSNDYFTGHPRRRGAEALQDTESVAATDENYAWAQVLPRALR